MSETIFYDKHTDTYFKSDKEAIKNVENELNDILEQRLSVDHVVTFAEVCNALGLPNGGLLERNHENHHGKENGMKLKRISKEEFCEKTHIKTDCWIFDEATDPKFWLDDSPEFREVRNPVYYYDNGRGLTREFEVMEKYHETWIRTRLLNNQPSLWSTFAQW